MRPQNCLFLLIDCRGQGAQFRVTWYTSILDMLLVNGNKSHVLYPQPWLCRLTSGLLLFWPASTVTLPHWFITGSTSTAHCGRGTIRSRGFGPREWPLVLFYAVLQATHWGYIYTVVKSHQYLYKSKLNMHRTTLWHWSQLPWSNPCPSHWTLTVQKGRG